MGSQFIFFEKQQDLMCGQHALNNLLQSNLFSAMELGEIANRLDDQQRALNGYPTNFISENASASGYFSVQVLEKALSNIGLSLKRITHPSMEELLKDPSKGRAYIVNHEHHWFAVRRFGNLWFILNSQYYGPRNITPSYMNLLFTHLSDNGCSIFHVDGDLPFSLADEAAITGQLKVEDSINDDASFDALRQSMRSADEEEFLRVLQQSQEEYEIEEAIRRSKMDSETIPPMSIPSKAKEPEVPLAKTTENVKSPTQDEIRAAREKFLNRFQ